MLLKPWKIWTATVIGFLLIVFGAIGIALYRNLDTEWSYQYTAAQRALNHSPISHISHQSTFTDIVSEEVFQGQDIFGRKWYVFVSGPPWTTNAVQASHVISKTQVDALAKQESIQPINVQLGYLTDQQSLSFIAPHHTVWQIYGRTAGGKDVYLYLDGQTGKQLWKYMLST
jgi:uncharacterized protein YpmB